MRSAFRHVAGKPSSDTVTVLRPAFKDLGGVERARRQQIQLGLTSTIWIYLRESGLLGFGAHQVGRLSVGLGCFESREATIIEWASRVVTPPPPPPEGRSLI